MRLSTLRRSRSRSLPGITATARVDRRTRNLVPRVRRGDIAVVDHMDMDRASAVALTDAGVVAVVNAAPSISGRYPNLGPRHLVDSGVVLVDNLGQDVMTAVREGTTVRVDGETVYVGEQLIGSGTRQDRRSVADAMESAKSGIASRLEAVSASAVEQLRRESGLLIDGAGLPPLVTPIRHRHALVVAKAFDYRRELASLKTYLRENDPVLVGVEAGADALLEAGFPPDLVICTGDDVSDIALRSGAEIVVTTSADGRGSAAERIDRLGVRATAFPTGCPAGDAALLLASANDAALIVTVGMPRGLDELLDTGRSTMASSLLTRAAVGSRVTPASAVSQLYTNRIRGWIVFVLTLLAVVAVAAAIATTPVGSDWAESVRSWLIQGYDWVRGEVT